MIMSIEDLKTIFTTSPDSDVQRRIDDENSLIMRYITFVFSIVGLIAMVIFLVLGNGRYNSNYSVKQASIGFLINFGYCLLARFAAFFSRNRNNKRILQTVYFIALIIWSINISIYHYQIGMQTSMFYIVIVCIVCLLTFTPKFTAPLILFSFEVYFLMAYLYDGAKNMLSVNYFSFAFMCVLGAIMRYRLKVKAIGQMVELERINAVLGREAREDKITGLRNRFGLTDDFRKFKGHELCIIMIDIDHFKRFNDTYGHIVGDKVLTEVSNALNTAFSPGSGYRFGGDELMVILSDRSEAEVLDKIDLFKKKIDEIDISEIRHKVTCSVGYAFGHVEETGDFLEVNQWADERLYESKKLRPEWY